MRSILLLAVLLVASAAVLPNARVAADSTTLALVGGRVYVSPTAAPIPDGVVLISGGVIQWVGPRSKAKIPAGVTTIDCTGEIVTAGFQNSHVHFTEDRWLDAAHQPAQTLASQLQGMLGKYGFTTVVDTASLLENTVALRKRIVSGEVDGPRILTAGLALYPPNGVPYYIKDNVQADLVGMLLQPKNADEATSMVRHNIDGGADIVKLFTGSWVSKDRALPMPDAIATAAVREGHRLGKLVFTHPSNLAGARVALVARVDVLAHAIEDTRELTPDVLAAMKAQNMAIIPTLKLFGEDRNIGAIEKEIRDYAALGGQILFGTDVGYLPDYSPLREYELMGEAGLDWRQILASLTTNPAARFSESARRGRIAPGMAADLVVLAQDPARDVRAFADVRHTIRAGRSIFSSR